MVRSSASRRGAAPARFGLCCALACWALGRGSDALAQETRPAPAESGDDDEIETTFEAEIEVVGLTALDSTGVPADELPWTQHALDLAEIEAAPPLGIGALLQDGIPGVHVNHPQGNPFQPDVHYRGFSTSPLLGASQEISVFEDGVRVNEVFGDVIAWDLLPTFALEGAELSAGANPVHGVNTLGGALALETRDGHRTPRLRANLSAGWFERRGADLGGGGAANAWGYFAGFQVFDEDGWRDFSPSRVRQGLAKVSHHGDGGVASLALGVADNDLIGNGTAPVQLLEIDRSAVFTQPDQTTNELVFPRFRFDRALSTGVAIEGVAYYRGNDVGGFNADAGDGGDDQAESEPNAVVNRSRTEQDGWGGSFQANWRGPAKHGDHRLLGSFAWDEGRAGFDASSELAFLTANRGAQGSGDFLEDAFVGVDTDVRRLGVAAAYHSTPASALALTLGARWTESRIRLGDRLSTELDGDHRYSSFLPSIGIAWSVHDRGATGTSLFAGLSRSSRVPTPVELTCADPDDPCRLPNAFVSDPPLEQVLTTSAELGLRGHVETIRWNASLFAGESRHDLVFVSSGASSSAGFFTNVDATRRQGVELAAQGGHGEVHWSAAYTHVEATFRDSLALPSPAHPAAVDGEIFVEPGDAIPGVPRRQLRVSVDGAVGRRIRAGGVLRHDSGRYLRGDEANLLDPISSATTGDVWVAVSLPLELGVELRVTNVTDAEYATFGGLGEADEVLSPAFDDPRFVTPGEPRAVLLTFRAVWD